MRKIYRYLRWKYLSAWCARQACRAPDGLDVTMAMSVSTHPLSWFTQFAFVFTSQRRNSIRFQRNLSLMPCLDVADRQA